MARFENVTIMMGAVDETDSIRNTVSEILRLCNHEDIREIVILRAPHITPECNAVVDEIAGLETDVEILTPNQKVRGLGGLTEVFEIARGSHCLIVASDMALDLECIPQMIDKAKENGDVIAKTSRWLQGCRFVNYNKFRHIMNFFGQIFLSVLFGRKMTDFTNPNQLVSTEIYKSIEWESKGFPILLELVLKPVRLGCEFVEIPSNCYGREQGKSGNSFGQTAKYFTTALHIRFMKKADILKK